MLPKIWMTTDSLKITAYFNLGHAFDNLSDYKQAESFNDQCLSIAKSLGNKSAVERDWRTQILAMSILALVIT